HARYGCRRVRPASCHRGTGGAGLERGIWLLKDYTGKPHTPRYGALHLQLRLKSYRVRWAAVVAFDRDREDALWGMAGLLKHFRVTFDGPATPSPIRFPPRVPPGFLIEPLPKHTRRTPGGSP